MNWQYIKEYGNLIYKTNGNDEPFCNWFVKEITCRVSYYEVFPLDDIDKIVCSILSDNNGDMDEDEMATILGFNVRNDFDATPKRYKDAAESDLFNAIIKPVFNWGLVNKNGNTIYMTALGKRAFERQEKYKFFQGNKILLENRGVNAISETDNLFFPYYQELGFCTEIKGRELVEYNTVDISLFNLQETDLIKRLNLQSDKQYNIYNASETHNFDFCSRKIDLRLYQFDYHYYPIVFYQDNICSLATEVLNNQANTSLKEKKVEWGLYLRLMNDPLTVLDYNTLLPFEDIFDIDNLITDKRLMWSDDDLFYLIASRADANQISIISAQCPIEVIKKHLLCKESTEWDWIVLSKRLDEKFVLEHPLFNWDYEIISTREDVSIDSIKSLLLIPDLKDKEWNWDCIMPRLDFQYIKDNIEKMDFDLYSLTEKNDESIQNLVCHYPAKKWDWNVISNNFDLSFILNNVADFTYNENGKEYSRLNLKTIIDRAFSSLDYAEKYCQSSSFKNTIQSCKDSLSYISANQEKYVWTDSVINFLESTGLLTWGSGIYANGFECNPYVEWNNTYFEKYHRKVTTDKGFSFVSESIRNPQIVIDYEDFSWNWLELSKNKFLISNEDFVKHFLDKFSLEILLPELDSSLIERLFKDNNLKELLVDNTNLWHIVTQKVTVEFVRSAIDYTWDWSVLTQRFFTTLKLDVIGNDKWINKWDWNYLTTNLDKQFIKDNLKKYSKYWDWDSLQRRFTTNELTVLTLTENDFSYKWNYEYLYSQPDFDIDTYLKQGYRYINSWSELSCSPALNKYLKYVPIFSKQKWFKDTKELLQNRRYCWDFKKLSLLDSINSDYQILSIQTSSWDWQYLSEHSGLFKEGNFFVSNVKRFSLYIDFKKLAARTDSGIKPKLIEDFIDKEWDWSALSNNKAIKFTSDFIQKFKNKIWDWKALSCRKDIVFSNEFLFELIDKDWDWQELSKRTDLVFDEDCIEKLQYKPLDWYIVTQSESFEPNQKTLSWLKDKNLDWNSISKSAKLDKSVLYDYKDLLDWKYVTKHISNDADDLNKFKDYLNWSEINQRKDFVITNEILNLFANYIDWNKASQSRDIDFTDELIEQYRHKWNWKLLKDNSSVLNSLGEDSQKRYQSEFNCIRFIDRFPTKSYVYHFTHLFNAVEIIRSKKIFCRKKVENNKSFYHCSGKIGWNRSKAYEYARFYYRPLTPNQLYNEGLGIDSTLFYNSWEKDDLGNWHKCQKTRRPKYEQLGMPKMPMPVCFKFDLEEIVFSIPAKCYYSDGCMQKAISNKYKITDEPNKLRVNVLYNHLEDYEYGECEAYKQDSMQEFLIKDGFDFSNIHSFEILCYNEIQYNLLKSELEKNNISCDNISYCDKYSTDIYYQENRQIYIKETDDTVYIKSNYDENGAYFKLESEDIGSIMVLNTDIKTIIKETNNAIYVYPYIKIQKDKPFSVYFVDEINQKWLIYRN